MSWYRSRHAGSSVTPALPTQQKTITATTSQQVVTPDSGYVLDRVTVNPQSHTAYSPSSSTFTYVSSGEEKTINLGENHNVRYVRVKGSLPMIQFKDMGTVTPPHNWNGESTGATIISPDSDFDYLNGAQFKVPMVRDNNILKYSTTDTPSTVYKGDTSVSNSKELMRVAPYKDGMIYTGSYLYVDPTEGGWTKGGSATNVTPSSDGAQFSAGLINMTAGGYAYTKKVTVDRKTDLLWSNSSPTSAMPAQALTLSASINNYPYIIFEYIYDNNQNHAISSNQGGQVLVGPEFIRKYTSATNTIGAFTITGKVNSQYWSRYIYYSSATKLQISSAYILGGTSSSYNDNHVILKYIYGLKLNISG